MNKTVYVGLSGGVDSSVSALLLKQQGFNVVGAYMKNWAKDLPGFECPWREDLADAKRVAVQLDIPFKIFDFQTEYKQKVVDYMLESYTQGRTPNPDVMCNQEIKFKVFLEAAVEDGADMVATGHYAVVEGSKLKTAADQTKDQTYFLYRMPKSSLLKTLFPLGALTKKEVRKIAEDNNLVTAGKKESMGICFVGKVGIKEFLSQYVETEPGEIIDESGSVLGKHDGAIFYTIGQRHGLDIGGGLPYYVVAKDMDKNTVAVSSNIDDKRLWTDRIDLTSLHWLADPKPQVSYIVRTRHLGELIEAQFDLTSGGKAVLLLKNPVRAITSGQSAVLYDQEVVVGGGIIV